VRDGSKREALLHAAGADQAVGLRRSSADKRRAVRLLLAAYPKWSNRKVGEACGVDDKTVAAVKRSLEPSAEIPHPETEPTEPGPPASDALVSRLAKALDRVIQEWPAERRAELCERLRAASAEPSV